VTERVCDRVTHPSPRDGVRSSAPPFAAHEPIVDRYAGDVEPSAQFDTRQLPAGATDSGNANAGGADASEVCNRALNVEELLFLVCQNGRHITRAYYAKQFTVGEFDGLLFIGELELTSGTTYFLVAVSPPGNGFSDWFISNSDFGTLYGNDIGSTTGPWTATTSLSDPLPAFEVNRTPLAPTPEPGTRVLWLTGIGLMIVIMRKRFVQGLHRAR
jgi:hypothetical protein